MERNLFLLSESLREDKIRFASHLRGMLDGLRRLRKLPNGRVDLLSLDEATRLNANMLANRKMWMLPAEGNSGEGDDIDQE